MTLSQDNDFFNDNFFIVCSDNLSAITPKIYGYIITDNGIYINSNKCNRKFDFETYGCYINITESRDTINIFQDYFGSFGIYFFKENDYFAVSNSFLYLVNFLKSKFILTINQNFAISSISIPHASFSYSETMINEISQIPRNSFLTIDKNTKKCKIEFYKQDEKSIDIFSYEGINLLDKWHNKWNKIMHYLIDEGADITFSLSGGKDSRTALSCLFAPQVDLKNVYMYCCDDGLYTHSEDFEIATQLSSALNFRLNNKPKRKFYKIDPFVNLKSSFFVKCGFHREIMPSNIWRENVEFSVNGAGGENLREHWEDDVDKFIIKQSSYFKYNTINCTNSLKKIMENSVKEIDANTNLPLAGKANDYFYKQCRDRQHNGKGNVERFLGNVVSLSPLMDPLIYKINTENKTSDLLFAVINNRYISEVDNVKFDSRHCFSSETTQQAMQINNNFRLKKKNIIKNDVYEKIYVQRIKPTRSIVDFSTLDALNDCFDSYNIKEFVYKYYGEEVYNRSKKYYKDNKYHPYIEESGLVQSYIIHKCCEESKNNKIESFLHMPFKKLYNKYQPVYYDNNGIMKEIYNFLQSIRFDIKNYKTSNKDNNVDNKIEIIDTNDQKMYTCWPEWFKDSSGCGLVVQSYAGKIQFKIRTINDGLLCIKIKGPWLLDSNKEIIPIKIDIKKFAIVDIKKGNSVYFMDERKFVDSFNIHEIKIECKNNNIYMIESSWLPYCYPDNDFLELIKKMKYISINTFKFWQRLK